MWHPVTPPSLSAVDLRDPQEVTPSPSMKLRWLLCRVAVAVAMSTALAKPSTPRLLQSSWIAARTEMKRRCHRHGEPM